jgi:hypothetical protein
MDRKGEQPLESPLFQFFGEQLGEDEDGDQGEPYLIYASQMDLFYILHESQGYKINRDQNQRGSKH